MSFFDFFPKTTYSFNFADRDVRLVTNIFSRVSMRQEVLDNLYAYYKYQLQDGDTPEIVAQKEYNNPQFHWVICYTNGLTDPVFDFPMPRDALERHIVKKYNYSSIANAYSEILHYVEKVESTLNELNGPSTTTISNNAVTLQQYDYTSNTLVLKTPNSSTWSNTVLRANSANANSAIVATLNVKTTIVPVTVYEYEDQVNEEKRQIKLLKQQYVEAMTNELSSVLNG